MGTAGKHVQPQGEAGDPDWITRQWLAVGSAGTARAVGTSKEPPFRSGTRPRGMYRPVTAPAPRLHAQDRARALQGRAARTA